MGRNEEEQEWFGRNNLDSRKTKKDVKFIIHNALDEP